jgi:hypothetical protein
MAAILPDGRATEIPMGEPRARGRRLPAREIRRLQGLVCSLLLDGAKLSPSDASRVFSEAINPDGVTKRAKRVPPRVRSGLKSLGGEFASHASRLGRV